MQAARFGSVDVGEGLGATSTGAGAADESPDAGDEAEHPANISAADTARTINGERDEGEVRM